MRRSAQACIFALLVGGCTTDPVMSPDLPLAERFELVALRDDAGNAVSLRKWTWPIKLGYVGDPDYRGDVVRHAELLGELAGVPVRHVEYEENLLVRIIPRRELAERANALAMELYGRDFGPGATRGFSCMVTMIGEDHRYWASVDIADDLAEPDVHRCIVQEMTQALGLTGDLDHPSLRRSRSDTAFASYDGSPVLTDHDIALIRILYDPRLRSGMRRDQAMPIVRRIVAEMEAQQEAGR